MGRFITATVTRQSNNSMEILSFVTQSYEGGTSALLSTFYETSRDVNGIGKAMGTVFAFFYMMDFCYRLIHILISVIQKGHLNDGYGISIRHYTKLLVTKLEFHDRNPRIPGNLTLKRGELESIAGNDVNF